MAGWRLPELWSALCCTRLMRRSRSRPSQWPYQFGSVHGCTSGKAALLLDTVRLQCNGNRHTDDNRTGSPTCACPAWQGEPWDRSRPPLPSLLHAIQQTRSAPVPAKQKRSCHGACCLLCRQLGLGGRQLEGGGRLISGATQWEMWYGWASHWLPSNCSFLEISTPCAAAGAFFRGVSGQPCTARRSNLLLQPSSTAIPFRTQPVGDRT